MDGIGVVPGGGGGMVPGSTVVVLKEHPADIMDQLTQLTEKTTESANDLR